MDKVFIGLGALIFGIVTGIQISFFAIDQPSNLKENEDETKIANGRYLRNINFKDHSYIFLRNSWNSAGDQFIHNPDCKCYINKEKL